MTGRTLALFMALPLAACAAQGTDGAQTATQTASGAPAIRVVGEPVSCIQTNRIQNTTVHDDNTIDFRMRGGPIYRNTLPNRCHSLGFEGRFSHRSPTGQLCSTDIITVLYSNGVQGPGCGLGQFLPVELLRDD